jgi:ribokinase
MESSGQQNQDLSKPCQVVTIGSLNMDLVVCAERLPKPGETLRGEELRMIPGGKGANQAVAVAQLGGNSTMVGKVGDDDFGKSLLQNLRDYKVDVSHVHRIAGCATGVAVINVERSGENSITIIAGANADMSPGCLQAVEGLISQADALILQLEIPLQTVIAAKQLAQKHGVLTVLDPAPAPPDGLPEELYDVDILTPNQSEAELMTGISASTVSAARQAAAELLSRGARQVVVKLGKLGALAVAGRKTSQHVEGFEVEVVDTTAAGDAFTAALALGSAEGMSLSEAGRFANAAGALATTAFGAQPSMPARQKTEDLLAGNIK